MTNFKNNLSCICKNAFSKELTDIHNNPVLSEKEKIDQMVNKISSILNHAALKEQRDTSKKKRIKRKRKQVWYDNEYTNKYKHLKFFSRQLAKYSWDNHLRSKIFYEHKLYKRLVRKKQRLFKNKLLGNLIENEKKNPKDFWNTVNTVLKIIKVIHQKTFPQVQHLKSLLNMDYVDNFPRNDVFNCFGLNNSPLNGSITVDEIQKCINSLKNGKSSGPDGISNGKSSGPDGISNGKSSGPDGISNGKSSGPDGLSNGKSSGPDGISNELKISSQFFIEEFVVLFNFIMKSEVYPDIWRDNIIKPIYKGGGTQDPSNYRVITVSICFGKLFSRVLFNRLDKYIEGNELIYPEQSWF